MPTEIVLWVMKKLRRRKHYRLQLLEALSSNGHTFPWSPSTTTNTLKRASRISHLAAEVTRIYRTRLTTAVRRRASLHSTTSKNSYRLKERIYEIVLSANVDKHIDMFRIWQAVCCLCFCRIRRCSGGERIVDVVPGGTELEPLFNTGSWAGRTHSQ